MSHKQQIVVMETCTTDTGATGQDDSHRSHGRQQQEPQQIQESAARNDRRYTRLEPRTTDTGDWSHKRLEIQILESHKRSNDNR